MLAPTTNLSQPPNLPTTRGYRPNPSSDQGSVLAFVAVFLAVAMMAIGALVIITGLILDQARAQVVADATALAAAGAGREAGYALAAANGATVISYSASHPSPLRRLVTVGVAVDGGKAEASAERYPKSHTTDRSQLGG